MNYKKSLKNNILAVGAATALGVSSLASAESGFKSYGADGNTNLTVNCKPKYDNISDRWIPRGQSFDIDNLSNGKNVEECVANNRKSTYGDRVLEDTEGDSFTNGNYTIRTYEYGSGKKTGDFCVNAVDNQLAFCDPTSENRLNRQFRNGKRDKIWYDFSGRNGDVKLVPVVRANKSSAAEVVELINVSSGNPTVKGKQKATVRTPVRSSSGNTGMYLSLDSGSSEVSNVSLNGNLANVSTSYGVVNDELLFKPDSRMEKTALLKDFIVAGIERPFKGQGGLVVTYQKSLTGNDNDGSNVGVSALRGELDSLTDLVGEQACSYNGKCYTVTQGLLEDSLRNHAIAESVASHYNSTQNFQNGYLSDVSKVAKLNDNALTLSQNPLLRIVLPINNVVQGGKDDYTHHSLNENVSESIKSNRSLENQLLSTSLVDFEQKVSNNVTGYLTGGNK